MFLITLNLPNFNLKDKNVYKTKKLILIKNFEH